MNTTESAVVPERLRNKIGATGLGCWLWVGMVDRDGYGRIHYAGQSSLAHRVMYAEVIGEIAPGLEVDHLCRNRACVNPAHLELVTRRENNRRKSEVRTHCKNGHELSSDNVREYVSPRDGANCRICRTCAREAQRRHREGGETP